MGGTIAQVEQKDAARMFGISQYTYKYAFTIVQMGLQFAKLLQQNKEGNRKVKVNCECSHLIKH